ncbi:MAG: hypothetical protein QOF02_2648 [Blastocatellia bacterium]|nr:hypothetical protein [Blastocatellia bacterium]
MFASLGVLVMQITASSLLAVVARIFPDVFSHNPPTGLQSGLAGLILMLFYALLIYVFLWWRERQGKTSD